MSDLLAGIGWFFGFVGLGLCVAIIFNGQELMEGVRDRLSRQSTKDPRP